MTTAYQIDENDFLTYQLFVASQSDSIKKKRQKSKLIIPAIYTFVGLVFLAERYFPLAITFLIFAILWFFIYPLWERKRYVNHYKNFIKENYQDRLGRTATLEFNNEFILTKDRGSESKISTTEIAEINEIPTQIFIKLRIGQSFILPKDKIADISRVKVELKELANHLKINYNIDENWEWR